VGGVSFTACVRLGWMIVGGPTFQLILAKQQLRFREFLLIGSQFLFTQVAELDLT